MKCIYCSNKVKNKNWETFYYDEIHYKIKNCEHCNMKLKITVPFDSDGSDKHIDSLVKALS